MARTVWLDIAKFACAAWRSVRNARIELAPNAWEALVLPLN